jgi:hypothetical protein
VPSILAHHDLLGCAPGGMDSATCERRSGCYLQRMRGAKRSDGGWTFVSNHFLVLLCIAEDPGQRMVDVSRRLGITERAVQGIVADLVGAGYLTRTKVGRRNHYEIDSSMPLRHLETEHHQLGELLTLLKHTTEARPRTA